MRVAAHIVAGMLAAPWAAQAEAPPRRRYLLSADLGVVSHTQSGYRGTLRIFGHPAFDLEGGFSAGEAAKDGGAR